MGAIRGYKHLFSLLFRLYNIQNQQKYEAKDDKNVDNFAHDLLVKNVELIIKFYIRREMDLNCTEGAKKAQILQEEIDAYSSLVIFILEELKKFDKIQVSSNIKWIHP